MGERSRGPRRILPWAVSILLALIFIPAGLAKLLGTDLMRDLFRGWGYSTIVLRVVGATELVGGAVLLFRRYALYGAGLLVLVMVGAILTHLAAGEWLYLPVPSLVLLAALYVAHARVEEARGWPGTVGRPARD